MNTEQIDKTIDTLSELTEKWARANCPHHAAETATALAALITARAEWERSR